MKLLIKIYIDNMNFYDLEQIVGSLNSSIFEKNTKIVIMTNDEKVKFDLFEVNYLNEINIPKIINYNLDKLDWDILLPITSPIIISKGFDSLIKKYYESKFHALNGILELNNDNNDSLHVIGKTIYKEFGYVYNPVYKRKNYEKELIDISKLKNRYHSINTIKFKIIEFKTDDDNIYEMRKKFNFNLL